MTTIRAEVPDYLAKLAEEAALKENTTIDQIIALALSAHIAAWNIRDDVETRAQRGKAENLGSLLASVPHRTPLPGDEL